MSHRSGQLRLGTRSAPVEYRVRRSPRGRRARIVVSEEGAVEVVVPGRMALRKVAAFVEENRPWIERTRRRFEAAREATPVRLVDGGAVPYLGEELLLRVRVEPGRVRASVVRRGGELHVAVGRCGGDGAVGAEGELDGAEGEAVGAESELDGASGGAAVRAALEGWYRRRARVEVAARLDAATRRAGRSRGPLSIRGQRTRWASCSSSGAMSFNWRLLLAPAPILDYVVEHEVAHLEVMDHSPRFWGLLAARCPDYRERERWLRRHGAGLRL